MGKVCCVVGKGFQATNPDFLMGELYAKYARRYMFDQVTLRSFEVIDMFVSLINRRSQGTLVSSDNYAISTLLVCCVDNILILNHSVSIL